MTGGFYSNSYNFVMPGQNLGAVCGTLSYLLGRGLATSNASCHQGGVRRFAAETLFMFGV
ncbi:MAG: hypothetical protein ACLRX5_06625 [Slackia sp.]